MKQKTITIDINEIPLSSSLGILAYGHIAFTRWREVKKEYKKNKDEEK